MNDVRFTQAFNLVLMLDQSDCLKHADTDIDPKNGQQRPKPCNRQIKAILIIYEWLLQLDPEKTHEDLQQEQYLNDRRCPHCRHHIN